MSLKRVLATALTLGMTLLLSTAASAVVTVYESEDKAQHLKVGAALKGSVNFDLNDDLDNLDPNFTLNDARIYTQAQILEGIGFAVTVDKKNGQDVNILDGYLTIKANDLFQIRAGRTKAPFDRATLAGTYNRLTWERSITSKYPSVYGGRNDGGAVWGTYDVSVDGGDIPKVGAINPSLKYQAGVFQGVDNGGKGLDDLLYAGRVSLNLLETEDTYTVPGSYFGTRNVLAIGTSLAYQKDAVGVSDDKDYLAWNADVLFDSAIEGVPGSFTLGAAVNLYDLDDAVYVPGDGLNEGIGFSVEAAYLAPWELGVGIIKGKIQPFFRYAQFEFDGFVDDGNEKQIDAGINYVLTKNALVTASYIHNELLGVKSDGFTVGIRFKF